MLSSAAVLLAVAVLWRFPAFVEAAYSRGAGQAVARGLAAVSGLIPWSGLETLIGLAGLWALASVARAAVDIIRHKRRLLNALACGLLRIGAIAAATIAVFYAIWGLNYARPDLVTRFGWDAPLPADEADSSVEELARLCTELIDAANRDYEAATGSSDLGRPSAPAQGIDACDRAIEEGYARVAARFDVTPAFAARRAPAKPVFASWILSHSLISGFYSPWTGEANYNREVPACELLHAIAHEKAHQRCVTSEDEANFFGYLACVNSDDTYVRYSGYLFGQLQLLRELRRLDAARAKELRARRCPGVARDIEAMHDFYAAHVGAVSTVTTAVNDTYLRANRVKGGIKSYAYCARLLVLYARRNDDTCLVPASSPS